MAKTVRAHGTPEGFRAHVKGVQFRDAKDCDVVLPDALKGTGKFTHTLLEQHLYEDRVDERLCACRRIITPEAVKTIHILTSGSSPQAVRAVGNEIRRAQPKGVAAAGRALASMPDEDITALGAWMASTEPEDVIAAITSSDVEVLRPSAG